MLRGIAVGNLDMNAGVLSGEGPEKILQEPRGQGREDAHAQLTFRAAPPGVHDLRAFIDVSKNLLGFRQKPLSGNGQAYTAAVTVKQRRTESVFHVAYPAADRGLLYANATPALRKLP